MGPDVSRLVEIVVGRSVLIWVPPAGPETGVACKLFTEEGIPGNTITGVGK